MFHDPYTFPLHIDEIPDFQIIDDAGPFGRHIHQHLIGLAAVILAFQGDAVILRIVELPLPLHLAGKLDEKGRNRCGQDFRIREQSLDLGEI